MRIFKKKPPKPHKKDPWLRITVLSLLILFILPNISFSQRTIPYVYVYLNQTDLDNVDYWMVSWVNDSLMVDSTSASIYQGGSWQPFTSSADSVRLQVMHNFVFRTEYTFKVTSYNASGKASAIPVEAYFIKSDVNQSNTVDGLDLIRLGVNFGRYNLSYRDFFDINGDGVADGLDQIQMALEWGLVWIP